MELGAMGRRFWDTTRGQLVALLRRSAHTVDELATALGVTDNAVRSHLTSLERDGLVRQDGVRRAPGAGKPAVVYELHPEAVPLFSRAYAPVLSAVLETVVEGMPGTQSEALLREVGHHLARASGGRATGDLQTRVETAARLLTSMGGDVQVESSPSGPVIQGGGCPLSAVVQHRPELCLAVESFLTDVIGEPVRTCCQHGPKPRCCFALQQSAA